MRIQDEGLALELAARLRVLGKSLEATCLGVGAAAGQIGAGSVSYREIRLQLEGFLCFLAGQDFAEKPFFPAIRHYIQGSLPFEPGNCARKKDCPIDLVANVITWLSDDGSEYGMFAETVAPSHSG